MKYYDIDNNGFIRSAYTIPQPGRDLPYLDEPTVPYPSRVGDQWVTDPETKTEGDKNYIRLKIISETPYFAMLMVHLFQKLLQKGIISATDFSQDDREEYQKILNFVNNYLNL